MIRMIKVLQWILGVTAGLSLIVAVIFKVTHTYILLANSTTFVRLTITCCLASIALSLIELTNKFNVPSGKE